MLAIGSKAPDFSAMDENGNIVNLSDFSGKTLVLYFYPKDSAPGCTAEACNLRDNYEKFLAKGWSILGVSKDSQASHQKFIDKYGLKQTLLADEDKQMVQAYDVWHEKTMCGKKYMGIVRSTYIIDENGVITGAFPKVKATENPADMLKQL